MAATPETATRPEEPEVLFHDDYIDEAERAELEHGASASNLFDLRTIIGGLFTLYGVYLTIYGILDDSAAVHKAAGVRINLWTGLGMLALGIGFLAWMKLRPLTVDEIIEGQAEGADQELCGETMQRERRAAGGH